MGLDNLLLPFIPSVSFKNTLTGIGQASIIVQKKFAVGEHRREEDFLAWGKQPGDASGRWCHLLHLRETWGEKAGDTVLS